MPLPVAEQIRENSSSPTWALRQIGLRLHSRLGLIAWSSLLFATLQSVCTFFAALDGLRTAIGIGAFALAESAGKWIDRFHVDWLRVPMVSIAVAGSLLNLLVLWQVRRLRNKPVAQWRQQPVIPGKLRMEWAQIALAVLTLILVTIEEHQHFVWSGHL